MRTFLLIALFAVSAAACNTVEGIGEDLSTAGEKLQRSADHNR